MFEAYILATVLAILALGNIILKVYGNKRALLAFNIIVLAVLLARAWLFGGSPGTYFNLLSSNPFSLFFIMLFTASMILLNLVAYARSKDYENFAMLGSFALVGMYLVASSVSLISIFLGLELMSIPSAFIVLLSRRGALEAATKLFIMASVAIAFLSFAIVLVYGSANSLTLSGQQQSSVMYFALVLFVAALGFEASIFPFNVLLPDVYQGSAGYATAMLGGLNKKVGLVALMQVLILVFISFHLAFEIVAALAVLTMFYGNIVALLQDNLKRMLAYSSISQAGYILIGIAVGNAAGLGGSAFQIFAHAFLFIGAMSIIAWLESRDRNEINDLIGLYRENRFAAVSLTIFMLSLVGLPFTTGFFGKFLIFLSAVNSGLAWLAFIGIINSVISVFYYAKVLTAMYTGKLGSYSMNLDRPTLAVVILCLGVTLLFGAYPQPVAQLAEGAGGYLFANATAANLTNQTQTASSTTSAMTTSLITTLNTTSTSTSSTISATTQSSTSSATTTVNVTSSASTTTLNATTTALIGIGIRTGG